MPGSDADQMPTVGHSIDRFLWASSRTCGRTVAKSVKCSGSISASGRRPLDSISVRTAVEAASPASFQPVKAATSTGRVSETPSGSTSHRT